jgi:hypothetical protein
MSGNLWPICKQPNSTIPDYVNDLNAIADAVNSLRGPLRNRFVDLLGATYSDSWEFCNATARERALVLLSVLSR